VSVDIRMSARQAPHLNQSLGRLCAVTAAPGFRESLLMEGTSRRRRRHELLNRILKRVTEGWNPLSQVVTRPNDSGMAVASAFSAMRDVIRRSPPAGPVIATTHAIPICGSSLIPTCPMVAYGFAAGCRRAVGAFADANKNETT